MKKHLNPPGSLKLKFQVMSDTEIIAGDKNSDCNIQFDHALAKIEQEAPDSSAIFVAGDVLNRGIAENWMKFYEIVAAHPCLPKVYPMLGNHDVTDAASFSELFANYIKYSGMSGAYYHQWIGGYHFIAIAQETAGHNKPEYSEEQFRWLEDCLAENSAYDKPIFLFSHYSIRNTSAGTYLSSQIGHSVGSKDKLRFMEILKKYPQVIYFTGHTHFSMEDPHAHYNIDLMAGHGADIICDGTISYLADGTWDYFKGAQFCFVEVYEKGVLIRGWDVKNKKWLENGRFSIDTTLKKPTEMAAPGIELSCHSIDTDRGDRALTACITYDDINRIAAPDGAWAGLVTSGMENVSGDVLRWVMLKNLSKDAQGRFIWNVDDDSICEEGSSSWKMILQKKGLHHIGLFEDTLYLGQQPTVPDYTAYCYDPYARLAKDTFVVGKPSATAIPGNGTEDAPYEISQAGQFIELIDKISAGEAFTGKFFLQTADLDFTELIYYIADSALIRFSGIYNGGGHKFLNLSLTGGRPQEFASVFPTVTGTILNVGIEKSRICGIYAAGIVRHLANGGKLVNSYCRADICASGHGGGLADYVSGENSMLDNCYFAGKTTQNAAVGNDWNSLHPILDRIYSEVGTAYGTSPFGTVEIVSSAKIRSQSFVKTLNANRSLTASAAQISEKNLAEWKLGADGYPTMVPIQKV